MSNKSNGEQEVELASAESGDDDTFELTPVDELELAKNRADELYDRLQRLQAEFDNYRKRMNSRFEESVKYASEKILLKLLDIYDNLERAIEADFEKDPPAAKKGVEAIKQQMEHLLTQEGVRPMDPLGQPFDPYYQHSVQKVNDPEKPDGVVLAVFQKGYMLREKVLRPALVVVNRHEQFSAEDSNKEEKSDEDGE